VCLQEQSLYLAAFDLLLPLDQVEWECESRSRGKPALQRREQVTCFLLSGYPMPGGGGGTKKIGAARAIYLSV
jgi:hypothetical protein